MQHIQTIFWLLFRYALIAAALWTAYFMSGMAAASQRWTSAPQKIASILVFVAFCGIAGNIHHVRGGESINLDGQIAWMILNIIIMRIGWENGKSDPSRFKAPSVIISDASVD